MKYKIFAVLVITIFIGNFISYGITSINDKYQESLAKEYFGGVLNKENYKNNPVQEIDRILRHTNIAESQKAYTEQYSRFVSLTFVARIVFGILLAYFSTAIIVKLSYGSAGVAHPEEIGKK